MITLTGLIFVGSLEGAVRIRAMLSLSFALSSSRRAASALLGMVVRVRVRVMVSTRVHCR